MISNFVNLVTQLGAGSLKLGSLINLNKCKPNPVEVTNFFIIMEVYGSQPLTPAQESFLVDGYKSKSNALK